MIVRGRRLAACLGLAALALTACGKKAPPVPPEQRAPQQVADLTGHIDESSIVLSWTPPNRRVDNTRQQDPTVTRVFRVEDSGAGEPKSAMLVDGRIAGYEEIVTIHSPDPAPALRRGLGLSFADGKGLTYGHRYTYVVITGDSHGRIGSPSRRVSVRYAPAPAEPESVVAEPGERTVRLRWGAATKLLDGNPVTDALKYEVLRAPSADADLTPIGPPVSENTLTDSGLENDIQYYYAVRAVRGAGGTTLYGRPSPRVAATPRDVTPPSPPANLVGIASQGIVRLSWSPSPEADVATYIVYRAPESGGFERIGSTTAPATTYADRTVTRGTYRYAVTAQDRAARPNESRRSNEVRVTLP